MAILRVRDENGNIIEIPAIKGDKGDDASATDVQINGVSIVKDGVANVPIAKPNEFGLVTNGTGVFINNGKLSVSTAAESHIINRTKGTYLTAPYIDSAVKVAMCDGKGDKWSAEEKTNAQGRMGLGWKLLDTLEIKEEVSQVQIDFQQDYNEFMIIADISGSGSCVIHPYVSYDTGGNRQGRQLLHSAYYPSDKDEHIELMFEKVKVGEDFYFKISGFEKTDYVWNLNKNIQTTGLQQHYDVTNKYQCDKWHNVKFARTITNAIFKIFAR